MDASATPRGRLGSEMEKLNNLNISVLHVNIDTVLQVN
jgi:hypothetical protein